MNTWVMVWRIVMALLLGFGAWTAHGQHSVDFQAPSTVCLGERVQLVNTSDAGIQTNWNFCADQLNGVYTGQQYGSMGVLISGISIVEEDGEWYGFLTSENSQLVRLSFGSFPANQSFTTTYMGNFGGLLPAPRGIDMVEENGTWYGFATTPGNEIIRLVWSNSLSEPPVAQSLDLADDGLLNGPMSIEVVKDGNSYVAVVANSLDNRVLLIDFGTSVTNTPTASDITQSSIFVGAANLTGVTVSRQCENWYIYAVATDKIYRVDMGATLSTFSGTSTIEFSADLPITLNSYNKIKAVDYNGDTYLYIVSLNGGYIAQVYWANGGASPVYSNIGSPSIPGNPFAIETYDYNGEIGLYVGGFNTGVLNHISITSDCGANNQFDDALEPEDVWYEEPGIYMISLATTFPDGVTCVEVKQVTVSGDLAPVLVISNEGICEGAQVQFHVVEDNDLTLTNVDWDFGDSGSGTGENPAHVYANAGTYAVTAEALGDNGCSNREQAVVKIYPPPVADFTSPSGLICTGSEFTFVNTTVNAFDGMLTFQWLVDAMPTSTQTNLTYQFTSTGDKSIELIASIPGCSDSKVSLVSGVQTGPNVGFTRSGQCADTGITFENTSTGDVTASTWRLDNGTPIVSENFTYSDATKGDHTIILEAHGGNSCVSVKTENFTVYSSPAVQFALDLPPFSCAGSPSQFHDLTPNPNDSNLASWLWNFDDGSTGTEKNPVHTYTLAQQYTVDLTVTTDKGCTKNLSKPVTISPSPGVDFTNNPACVGKPTLLSGTSAAIIKSWQWKIGPAIYQQQNATHTFSASGPAAVQLTATATNNCISTITRPVNVPVVPMIEVDVVNACAGQEATLRAEASATGDAGVGYAWTFGGGASGTGQEVTRTYAQPGNYPVALEVTMTSGCKYSHGESVVIHAVPSVSFTPAETYGAAPLGVQFTNSTTGASTYLWHFTGGEDATSDEASPAFTYTQLGTYTVTLEATSADGCTGNSNGKVYVIVPYADLSLEDFSLLADAHSGTSKGVVRIRNNGNYPATPVNLVIDLGTGVLLTETLTGAIGPQSEVTLMTSSSIGFQNAGNGFVCVSAVFGNDQVLDNNRECLTVGATSELFEPYPNPSDGTLSLQVISPANETVSIRIVNGNGADAYSKDVDAKAGLNVFELDLSMLTAGLYVIQVYTSTSQILTRRISIQY